MRHAHTHEERRAYVIDNVIIAGATMDLVEGSERLAVEIVNVTPKCMVTVRFLQGSTWVNVGETRRVEPFKLRRKDDRC